MNVDKYNLASYVTNDYDPLYQNLTSMHILPHNTISYNLPLHNCGLLVVMLMHDCWKLMLITFNKKERSYVQPAKLEQLQESRYITS